MVIERMPFQLLMPSYNQAHYIVDAVNSILAQDDHDWELWIVDNSSDDTPRVMAEFKDPRIHFNHIPKRMDPGSCLNWMLERVSGRDFSYVHTDNNLYPNYVRTLRTALASHPFALAYCDMRTIDQSGRHVSLHRRGSFDLARMLSTDPLGVPFAATLELARHIGGFSVEDYADDVRFCVSGYGRAHYVYVAKPLLDYRVHDRSRTEQAGGYDAMQRAFYGVMPKIIASLARTGAAPLAVIEESMSDLFGELDLLLEDMWYRKFSRRVKPWWRGFPKTDDFFFAGFLDLEGFAWKHPRPGRSAERPNVSFWHGLKMRQYFYRYRRQLRVPLRKISRMLTTWALSSVNATADTRVVFRVKTINFRTVWIARQLELMLGWTPVSSHAKEIPSWLGWRQAKGDEPVLDCRGDVPTLALNDGASMSPPKEMEQNSFAPTSTSRLANSQP